MSDEASSTPGVRIAVEGCGHGTLNAIYAAVETSCKERGWDGVDLLIIGGDFQATRNADDLTVMSVPAKYRELGDFHEYYSGVRRAPYLTVFVAGNHEASSYLWELYYGGWVAPNIYYLGAANVLRLGRLRIAGMSGIWKGFDYRRTHHERLPFGGDDVKSFYHVREFDVRKLLQVRTQVDVGISHDWPRAIERHGDERHLFRMKPAFETESRDGTLGNPAAEYVMDRLRPPYWFSAHMHCKFSAIKSYEPPGNSTSDEALGVDAAQEKTSGAESKPGNPDEIDLDTDEDDEENEPPKREDKEGGEELNLPGNGSGSGVSEELRAQLPESFLRPQQSNQQSKAARNAVPGQPVPAGITNTTVRFLALDKCLPGRKFLQLCEIQPADSSHVPREDSSPRYKLQYDPEWLAITRAFAPFLTIGDRAAQTPPDLGEAAYLALIERECAWVEEHIVGPGRLDVPENFAVTAPPHAPGAPEDSSTQPDEYSNPQTAAFCALVGVANLWDATPEERLARKQRGPPQPEQGHGWGGGRGRGGSRGGRGGRGGGGGRGRGWGANRGRGLGGGGMRP